MNNQLTIPEKRAFIMMRGMKMNTYYGHSYQMIAANPTSQGIKLLISHMLEQAKDAPQETRQALGFDLPKLLKVKFQKLQTLNADFANQGFAYRAMREVMATDHTAEWVARASFFSLKGFHGTVYVDSKLQRYVRLSTGQLFECTSGDLQGMPEIDKTNIRAYLTGLID